MANYVFKSNFQIFANQYNGNVEDLRHEIHQLKHLLDKS